MCVICHRLQFGGCYFLARLELLFAKDLGKWPLFCPGESSLPVCLLHWRKGFWSAATTWVTHDCVFECPTVPCAWQAPQKICEWVSEWMNYVFEQTSSGPHDLAEIQSREVLVVTHPLGERMTNSPFFPLIPGWAARAFSWLTISSVVGS